MLKYVALFVAGIVAGAVVHGAVLSVLWGWFIVPVFNAPPLPIPAAIGVALTVRFLAQSGSATKPDDEDGLGGAVGTLVGGLVLAPLLALAFGYVVHLSM